MKKNLGKWDRLLRIISGTVIIAVSLYYKNWWFLLGAALLLNGLSGRCGGYALFGFSTADKTCDLPNNQNPGKQTDK
ncbi:YgaP family membrane protein [Methylophaga sp.]|uniref:YgaP family membrane protein n=1 Tax=Methylophaga sp. TaxID=2024840 RepID=UPI003F698F05